MHLKQIPTETEILAEEIETIIPEDLAATGNRFAVSGVACSLSLEHWNATKILLAGGMFPSAVVVHRTQFETIVRSIWLLYAASETELAKLTTGLAKETEQAAKNIAGLQEMIADIEKRGPIECFRALARFRDNALKPMNSYVHAGLHPLHRHASGYPTELAAGVLRNSNGVALLSWMQTVVLSGRQDLQRTLLEIAARHPGCMPSPI